MANIFRITENFPNTFHEYIQIKKIGWEIDPLIK